MKRNTIHFSSVARLLVCILLLCSLSLSAQTPKREVRAVWLTTIGGIDWPHSYAKNAQSIAKQQQELTRTLDQLQRAGINTVIVQTRVRATTIFPSGMEPWDGCLSGTPGVAPGYDALQFCIDECHRRSMECHAWIVTIPVGKWTALGCRKLREKYPKLIKKIGDEGYMDPETGETGDYLARFCRDVTRRYDVDGIHLDYIRYPETWKLKVSRAEGRRNITSIVSKIHRAVKAEKPWVKLSCSPIGKHDDTSRFSSSGWNAYTIVCQDAQGWLRDGLMDWLFPMMYFQGNHFYPFLVDWQQHQYGRVVVPGLAVYMLHQREKDWPLEVISREMSVCRQEGMGHTFFRSKFLTDNTKGIYQFTCDFNQLPALTPAMSWTGKPMPQAPQTLSVKRGLSSDQLQWTPGRDRSQADYLFYNVYASDTWPVDISDSRNLVACRLRMTDRRGSFALMLPNHGRTRHYAITAMDRYGQESQPTMTQNMSQQQRRNINFRELVVGRKHNLQQ